MTEPAPPPSDDASRAAAEEPAPAADAAGAAGTSPRAEPFVYPDLGFAEIREGVDPNYGSRQESATPAPAEPTAAPEGDRHEVQEEPSEQRPA
jgi:hypothetical protein